jgi:hypothetical protein
MRNDETAHAASFRDPSGFLFVRSGVLYRQVNQAYREHYDHLLSSGLYERLTESGLLIRHEETSVRPPLPALAYKVLKPEPVPFVSYPYEWCFSQLKDAALATLRIQKTALEFRMILKDASAYNIQFRGGAPVLIDTLSFEVVRDWKPWIAYRQFCQHFLAPLALMARKDERFGLWLRIFIDGIPLDLASRSLPGRTRLSPGLLAHIHAHAASQKHYAARTEKPKERRFSKTALLGLVDSLESNVRRLKFHSKSTEWGDYYGDTNYTADGFEHKKRLIAEFLEAVRPATVWDLGANTGLFSRIASSRGIPTVSFDVDPLAVERNYRDMVARREANLLPLVMDLTNPSPGVGWDNRERMSLEERGPADAALALALIHHLAISNNLPFDRIVAFFRKVGRHLIVEFVPKEDSQVRRLLVSREDIFGDYDRAHFEEAFGRSFRILRSAPIQDSGRILYLMRAKPD